MLKKIIFLLLLVTILYSCTNVVVDINTDMRKKFDNELSNHIDPFVTTISFYYYANPENYWYPEGTTYREIIDDEFRQGYSGLEKLDRTISDISTSDSKIMDCAKELHLKIKETEKGIREMKKSLRQLNGVFGFGLLGGVNTLLDFGELLGGDKSKEDEGVPMPKDVKKAFDNLVKAIEGNDYQFCFYLRKFEFDAIGNKKLNDEQLREIRADLKLLVLDQIKHRYTDADTIGRDKLAKMLLTTFDNSFPIGLNNFSGNYSDYYKEHSSNDNEQSYDDKQHEVDSMQHEVDNLKTDRATLQADFDAVCAKIDQLDQTPENSNGKLLQDKADLIALSALIRKTLSNRNATGEDLKKAREMINDLNDNTKKYEAHLAETEKQ